jgi:hypothetical protein
MRSARFNLEDQVGGLIDHGDRRVRRREAPSSSEPVEPEGYDLAPQPQVAIRATRASGADADRRVA